MREQESQAIWQGIVFIADENWVKTKSATAVSAHSPRTQATRIQLRNSQANRTNTPLHLPTAHKHRKRHRARRMPPDKEKAPAARRGPNGEPKVALKKKRDDRQRLDSHNGKAGQVTAHRPIVKIRNSRDARRASISSPVLFAFSRHRHFI